MVMMIIISFIINHQLFPLLLLCLAWPVKPCLALPCLTYHRSYKVLPSHTPATAPTSPLNKLPNRLVTRPLASLPSRIRVIVS